MSVAIEDAKQSEQRLTACIKARRVVEKKNVDNARIKQRMLQDREVCW